MMKVDGACHCGAITVEGEILNGSRSAIAPTARPVPGRRFAFPCRLPVKTTAENGNPRINAFCPTCGSPIYSSAPGDDPPESYMLRVGILRQRDQLTPRRQIWFRSAQAWITDIGGVPKEEKQTGTSHLR
jgi:hypothetical protein